MISNRIRKILMPLSSAMAVMAIIGGISTPVLADELGDNKSSYEDAEETKENSDNAVYINKEVNKNGFKIKLNKVLASKHKLEVTAVIESPTAFDEDSFYNSILMATIKNSKYDVSSNKRYIDDKTVELRFDLESIEGFKDDVDLRFDVVLPHYDLNAWVQSSVNISKNFDKVLERDISFNIDKLGLKFDKFESDVLGTTIYCNKEEDHSNNDEDSLWDSQSKILLKYNDRLYEFDKQNSYYYHESGKQTESYTCRYLKYDDLKDNVDKCSLIPVVCNIKNKEIDDIFNSRSDERESTEELNNVKYVKNYNFYDGSKGQIYNIEREDNKVKVYCKADSEKKSLIMALGVNGENNYDSRKNNSYYNENAKSIYKDSNDEYGYVVEFDDVKQGDDFNIYNDDLVLGIYNKVEFGEEFKIN